MSGVVILPQKAPDEDISITFNFFGQLQFGEVIIGATTGIAVVSGIDANPSAMLSGVTTNDDTAATQLVIDGVAGVVYSLACTAVTNLGHRYILAGKLYVKELDNV